MANVSYVTPTTPRSETIVLTLPGNLGLVSTRFLNPYQYKDYRIQVFGAMLLICLGNLFGHGKHTLIVSFIGKVFLGGMIGLVTPYNKGLMIAFTFLEQAVFAWAQYESVAFIQLVTITFVSNHNLFPLTEINCANVIE
jgi:hypothetical protein